MKKFLSIIATVLVTLSIFGGTASAAGSTGARVVTDSLNYGSLAKTVDVTLTRSGTSKVSWTMTVQYLNENGSSWNTLSGTTKTGYVSSSSPSYRSYYTSSLRMPWPQRIKVKFADGSAIYSSTFYVK